jgi:hypothetical protein
MFGGTLGYATGAGASVKGGAVFTVVDHVGVGIGDAPVTWVPPVADASGAGSWPAALVRRNVTNGANKVALTKPRIADFIVSLCRPHQLFITPTL